MRIEAVDGFTYTYKLFVGNKELEKFARESNKNLAIWENGLQIYFNTKIYGNNDAVFSGWGILCKFAEEFSKQMFGI